ncbi:MAG TPA: non-canonical purine NTP pyrophosphatase, RdgB/HAM1 family [Candidatus Omnitrophica bacterium]|nr:MAG: non-canonical purine NTP pyrophosphatase, RdgB/HAM1 family [Omnitrophica WOR_2 bacterium GWA2_63_20]OGX17645.1 MAG: non-canonical purine NTP pyrophosphatase, RdgB/HAM1 family [Omnitrophica WOR_2 bacterium GWF2_63_9]OGX33021.1 MAG: non-canonical purine NTP pyrophosphatase, RdgB/HAM1 family [Omnitrophica WOR_2 bacterium RIFCSPHIGHO2_12_FULL_64_13]OGX35080.1 MAG: non-canonical purine NTP pyrophosphatase, RdgB/HAM1 family [Omnitrophica WOR_2 bacterium RIFCSPHIGHO2_02_FULL_63_39]OGX45838.1 M
MNVVIATRNPEKFRELKTLLAAPRLKAFAQVRWRSLEDHPSRPSVREDASTFRGNAVKKARAIARFTHCLALADDSGLEVEALGGGPGVRSARFAGRHGDNAANNAKVLRLLRGVAASRRGAQFRCVLALAGPRGLLAVTEGIWRGRVAEAPAGRRGFGYDPIFFLPRLGKTSAQLAPALKNRLSHRGHAARAMRRHLLRLLT